VGKSSRVSSTVSHRRIACASIHAFVVLLCVSLGSSCLNVDWTRNSRYHPVPEELEPELVVGESQLDDCLAQLGAPLWVLEHPIKGRDGALLAWGWYLSNDIGVNLSYAFDRYVSSSVDYKQSDADMEGLVAIFDQDWRLVEVKRGLLRDLASEFTRARPRAVLTSR
jgi:hypothetical protein